MARSQTPKVGWRVGEWCKAVGISRAWTFRLLKKGEIDSVIISNARIITMSPREFLEKYSSDAKASARTPMPARTGSNRDMPTQGPFISPDRRNR